MSTRKMIRRGRQSVRANRNRTRQSSAKQTNRVRRSLSKTRKQMRVRKSKKKPKPKKLTPKSKKTIQQWKKILKEKGINYEPKKSKSKRKSKMKGGSAELFELTKELGEVQRLYQGRKDDSIRKQAIIKYELIIPKYLKLSKSAPESTQVIREIIVKLLTEFEELKILETRQEDVSVAGGGAAVDRSLEAPLEAPHPEIDRSQVLGRIVEVEMTSGENDWRKGQIIGFNKNYGKGASEHVILFDLPREKRNIKLAKGGDKDPDKKKWRVIEGELTKLPLPTFEAPRWVPDDESAICMLCDQPFGVTRWRYNCLSCGILVCHSCSGENKGIYEYFDPTQSTTRLTHPRAVYTRTPGLVGQAGPTPKRVCTKQIDGRTPCAEEGLATTHPTDRARVMRQVALTTLGDRSNDWLRGYIDHINKDKVVYDPQVQELINMAQDVVKLETKDKQATDNEYHALKERFDKLKGVANLANLPSIKELEERLLALQFPDVPTYGLGRGGGGGGVGG